MGNDWDKIVEEFLKTLGNTFDESIKKLSTPKFPRLDEKELCNFLNKPYDSTKKPDTKNEKPDTYFTELFYWLPILKHPSIIVILGGRGRGKSALGYKIAEYLNRRADIFIVGLPRRARKLLPDWIGSVPSIEDIPLNAVAIIDESHNFFHSRTSSSERSKILSNMINLSRQRGQTLIFITQEARQIDKNITSSANVIIFKNPGIMQFEFERKELKKLAEEAKRTFASICRKRQVSLVLRICSRK